MSDRSLITTRVLNLTTGKPAVGVFIVLEHYQDTEHDWQTIAEAKTDKAGRAENMLPAGLTEEGLYRLTFDTDAYFGERDVETFYSSISINFQVTDTDGRYYIPLLLSPFGYSTFRAPE